MCLLVFCLFLYLLVCVRVRSISSEFHCESVRLLFDQFNRFDLFDISTLTSQDLLLLDTDCANIPNGANGEDHVDTPFSARLSPNFYIIADILRA